MNNNINNRNTWIDIISKLYKNLHMSKTTVRGMNENDKKRDEYLKKENDMKKLTSIDN